MASSINKYSVVESLNQMIYESATAVAAVDGGSGATGDQTLPDSHTALYVGVGGDVVLTLQSGSDATFKNLASATSPIEPDIDFAIWSLRDPL